MYNLFESCENKTADIQQKYFKSRSKGTDRPSENMQDGGKGMLSVNTDLKSIFKFKHPLMQLDEVG